MDVGVFVPRGCVWTYRLASVYDYGRCSAHSVDATMAMDEDMGTVAVISPAGVAQGQFFMVDRLSEFCVLSSLFCRSGERDQGAAQKIRK